MLSPLHRRGSRTQVVTSAQPAAVQGVSLLEHKSRVTVKRLFLYKLKPCLSHWKTGKLKACFTYWKVPFPNENSCSTSHIPEPFQEFDFFFPPHPPSSIYSSESSMGNVFPG